MQNFQGIVLYEHKYIGRFSNLHQCTFKFFPMQLQCCDFVVVVVVVVVFVLLFNQVDITQFKNCKNYRHWHEKLPYATKKTYTTNAGPWVEVIKHERY